MAKLNEKQKRFCEEYMIDMNATQAAIRAGYSQKTSYSIGQRLLKKVEAQEYITELKQKQIERVEITADRVLTEIAKIAFAQATDYVEFTAFGTKLKEWDDLDKTPIAGGKDVFDKDGAYCGTEVKFHSKEKALEMLGRHLKLFTDKVEHSGEVTLNTIMDRLQGKKQ